MNKKQLHHFWTIIRPIKVWYLAALCVISATVCVFALRHNNVTMIELREAVYRADKENGDVEGALRQLRTHVYRHMNTNLATGNSAVYPPIQLKYTYQRLQEAEEQRVERQSNSAIYTEAQTYCEQQNSQDFSGRNRIPCIEKYVAEHGVTPAKAQTIPDAMYKFDFYSPRWSPDLAGFSLAFTILLLLLTVLRAFAGRLLRRLTT